MKRPSTKSRLFAAAEARAINLTAMAPTIKLILRDKKNPSQKRSPGCFYQQSGAFYFLNLSDLETNTNARIGVERVAFGAIFAQIQIFKNFRQADLVAEIDE